MRIVTDGKLFALEKGWIFKKYASLYNHGLWRDLDDSYLTCWDTQERIMILYDLLKKRKVTVFRELE
jgi:hypothetical protein